MAKSLLPLGTWGDIWTIPVHHDARGRVDRYEARANYRDFDGQTRTVAARGKNVTEASNVLRTKLKERVARVGSDGLQPTDRFSVGAELFMANLKVLIDDGVRAHGTYETYEHNLNKNVLPRMGGLQLVEVTTPRVNKVIVGIKDEVGVGSAKTCKSIIAGVMALAVRDGALQLNPVREISIVVKTRRKPPRALSAEEREQWFELLIQDERAARADLIDLCKFMLATGERIGETLAVRWADVSLDTGEVNCSHQIQRRKGVGLVRVRVKSEAGDRVLLLPDWAVDMLRARWRPEMSQESPIFADSRGGHRDPHNVRSILRAVRTPVGSDRRQELGRVLKTYRRGAGLAQQDVVAKLGWKKTRISLIETGRVRLEDGEVQALTSLYKLPRGARMALLELTELAGVRSIADELAWVTSHIFRKTTATILDDAGHSARQVADQLGHSKTSTTQDDYIGRKVRNPAAAKALDDALRSLHGQGQEPEGP